MEITEIKVRLMDRRDPKLKAFCSITLDNAFVVRDLKVIDGVKGPFVAMPNRKLTDRCPNCRENKTSPASPHRTRLRRESAIREACPASSEPPHSRLDLRSRVRTR